MEWLLAQQYDDRRHHPTAPQQQESRLRGNNGRNGQAGAYQQPNFQRGNPGQNANWQGQPRFQQPRPQVAPNMMRPNANMMARQPGGFGNIVNRAASTAARVAPRRR